MSLPLAIAPAVLATLCAACATPAETPEPGARNTPSAYADAARPRSLSVEELARLGVSEPATHDAGSLAEWLPRAWLIPGTDADRVVLLTQGPDKDDEPLSGVVALSAWLVPRERSPGFVAQSRLRGHHGSGPRSRLVAITVQQNAGGVPEELWRRELKRRESFVSDFFVEDLDGDGVAELVVCWDSGGSGGGQFVEVFSPRNGASLALHYTPKWCRFEDLDGDDLRELISAEPLRCNDAAPSNASQVLWEDVLRYRDGAFIEANAEFVAYFQARLAEIARRCDDANLAAASNREDADPEAAYLKAALDEFAARIEVRCCWAPTKDRISPQRAQRAAEERIQRKAAKIQRREGEGCNDFSPNVLLPGCGYAPQSLPSASVSASSACSAVKSCAVEIRAV